MSSSLSKVERQIEDQNKIIMSSYIERNRIISESNIGIDLMVPGYKLNSNGKFLSVNIKFAQGVKVHPFVFVMAKSEYGDRIVLTDGRATVLKYNMGKELDTALLLALLRFLRAAKEDSKQFES